MNKSTFWITILAFLPVALIQAQSGNSEFEKRRVDVVLNAANTANVITALKDDAQLISTLKPILNNNTYTLAGTPQTPTDVLSKDIYNTLIDIDNYGANKKGENAAVIFVYRDINAPKGSSEIDFASFRSLVYHKKRGDDELSSYLLETKKIFFVFIDLDDSYYLANPEDNDKKLSNTSIKVEYKTSFFKKSFEDLTSVWQMSMSAGKINAALIKLTLVEVTYSKVKPPCDIVLTNKSFKENKSFAIHERNFASFQIGIQNNKYQLNNFSLSGGNLVVKPNDEQKENWKSNMYALLEVHIPRDIDNFQPIWKLLGKTGEKRTAGKWLYDLTISRVGVYGGLKIGKDPLSSLYAGFNIAITKELSVNLGWAWNNEVVPQVTEVGDIASLDDAMEYAKRKYGKGEFSWGLSFSPGSLIKTLGLKKE